MDRRQFIGASAAVLSSGSLLAATASNTAEPDTIAKGDWSALRKLFPLDTSRIQMATFLLASHPKPVANAIEAYRQALDNDPALALYFQQAKAEARVRQAAAAYMGGSPEQIALTDSTTMGLSLVYSGLALDSGDEVLHTTHDHYSTFMSLAHRAERTGSKVRQVALYDDPATANEQECVQRLSAAINPATRIVGVTWVHSSTGVKLPIKALASLIEAVNAKRPANRQIIFCVDGVHGFGVEDLDISEVACDFFIAGTHKWLFGPRGTGLIWGSAKGWEHCRPVIPSFGAAARAWQQHKSADDVARGDYMTPGGFHSFEHRWALDEAFNLHLQLGKREVQARIHELNTLTKEGLSKLPGARLITPMSAEMSSGLVCFELADLSPAQILMQMVGKGVVMSTTPYHTTYARLSPSLLNNEGEIEQVLGHLASLKRA